MSTARRLLRFSDQDRAAIKLLNLSLCGDVEFLHDADDGGEFAVLRDDADASEETLVQIAKTWQGFEVSAWRTLVGRFREMEDAVTAARGAILSAAQGAREAPGASA